MCGLVIDGNLKRTDILDAFLRANDIQVIPDFARGCVVYQARIDGENLLRSAFVWYGKRLTREQVSNCPEFIAFRDGYLNFSFMGEIVPRSEGEGITVKVGEGFLSYNRDIQEPALNKTPDSVRKVYEYHYKKGREASKLKEKPIDRQRL
jgi:hypothetical protein